MTTITEDTPLHTDILEFVRMTEDTITDTGRGWGKAACDLLPADAAPVGRLVDQTFDFTASVLAGQRSFVTSLLDGVFGEPNKAVAPPS